LTTLAATRRSGGRATAGRWRRTITDESASDTPRIAPKVSALPMVMNEP
jgi:hypothetical protein